MHRIRSFAFFWMAAVTATLTTADALRAQWPSRRLGTPVSWQVLQGEVDSETVSGVVLGVQGPLEGVMVGIDSASLGALTDEQGFFEFETPPPGEWVLTFRFLGFETIKQPIVVPERSRLRVTAIMARQQGICDLWCMGTSCDDLGLGVVDASTGRAPNVPIRFRVGFEGEIITDSVIPPPSYIIGFGKTVETVGWHSLEVTAKGYRMWRKKVWLENVPACGNQLLLGREHTAELLPLEAPRRRSNDR